MTGTRNSLRFLLNDETIELGDARATETLLDFLRLEKRLSGTKEGCAEGDCGACTVLVGRLRGGELEYQGVTSCIAFVGALDGAHVVTIEHLSAPDGPLHPVQQAMLDLHGSQCGFCTPGIVMSLYALWMRDPDPSTAAVERALQGNLCRCTGYAPIVRAARAVSTYGAAEKDPLVAHRAQIKARLAALKDGRRVEIGDGRDRLIVPASVDDLAGIYAAEPGATLVSGSTDVGLWVTRFMRDIGPLVFIGEVPELHRIERSGSELTLGAAVTYTEAAGPVTGLFPQLAELWSRIGGDQVRNMGTVGGNIANGSPIGDTLPPLIALGARITLRKGASRREARLEDYFVAYGKQDRQPGEFIESVTIPLLPEGERFACYKVTKRRDEDVSSLCGAFRVSLDAGGKVAMARIAFGGMAATPKRAVAVEAALLGRPWDDTAIEVAAAAFPADFEPITDMRASAAYRMLAAQNLLRRFHLETTGAAARLVREVA